MTGVITTSTTITIEDKKWIDDNGLKINYIIRKGIKAIKEETLTKDKISELETTNTKQAENIHKLNHKIQELVFKLDEYQEKEAAQNE